MTWRFTSYTKTGATLTDHEHILLRTLIEFIILLTPSLNCPTCRGCVAKRACARSCMRVRVHSSGGGGGRGTSGERQLRERERAQAAAAAQVAVLVADVRLRQAPAAATDTAHWSRIPAENRLGSAIDPAPDSFVPARTTDAGRSRGSIQASRYKTSRNR